MIKYIKSQKWVPLAFPLIIFGLLLPFCFKPKFMLFPADTGMELTSYIDTAEGNIKNNSTIISSFDTKKSNIDLQYTIGSKNLYPYAGFQWIVKPDHPFSDISKYDHLTFKIDPSTNENVLILILQFYVDGFSKPNDHMTWQYLSKEVPLQNGVTTYSIPLKEFQTPLWWYNQYKLSEKDFGHPSLKKLGMISVEEGSDAVGIPRRILMNKIYFENKNGLYRAIILSVALMLFYIIYGLLFWIRKSNLSRKKTVIIPYQQLSVDDSSENEEKKVLEYIGSNFSNQLLSLSFMSNETGISSNKISVIIKDHFNLSFRQYINSIRIAEAKRLLQETKLQISQIAYKVGYTNLTHFCRTFKEVTSISPNAFRQDSSEAQEEVVSN